MISILSLERIAKKNDIKRISKDALELLQEILSEEGIAISEKAVKMSKHANRRTVMQSDIVIATGKSIE